MWQHIVEKGVGYRAALPEACISSNPQESESEISQKEGTNTFLKERTDRLTAQYLPMSIIYMHIAH